MMYLLEIAAAVEHHQFQNAAQTKVALFNVRKMLEFSSLTYFKGAG